jgi:hypothetical protein
MSSLQDLTEAALDDFQFSRQRAPRDKSTSMMPPSGAPSSATPTTTTTTTQYVPMAFRTLARSSSGSGFGILRSAADMLGNGPLNNSGFQLPYRAVAGTAAATTSSGLVAPLGGSVTNMNALFANGGNSNSDFQFRPAGTNAGINNASTSLTTLAGGRGGATLGFNDPSPLRRRRAPARSSSPCTTRRAAAIAISPVPLLHRPLSTAPRRSRA